MSSGTSQAPISLDPGKPIDVFPVYFWDWVEFVRKYWEKSRGTAPLSSRVDLFPIVYKRYHARAGSTPNLSAHISYLGTKGLLRRFGEKGSFWIPETEAIIRVSGKIVYTPSDLDDLLAGDVRFQTPSKDEVKEDQTPEEPDEVRKESEQEAAQVVEDEAPVAEEVSKKKPRVRRKNPEQKFAVGRLVKALWAAAEPTDDPAWRVVMKSTAREHAVRECGHVLNYTMLYRLGYLKSGVDHDTCLVTDAPGEHHASPSEPTAEQAESVPPAASPIDSSILDMEVLKRKLHELEAKYDTRALEGEHDAMEPRIEEARSRAEDLRKQAQALDESALALTQEQRKLSDKIEQLVLAKQQDPEILDLHWAIANHDRLKRVMGKV